MSEAVKTGYPSIDKPWGKYFDACDGGERMEIPQETIFDYLKKCNEDNLDGIALDFFGHTITYREFFGRVEEVAKALHAFGVKPGEVVNIITVNAVESYELMYAINRVGAVFDFINCLADHKDLVHYFQDSEAKRIFVMDLFADKVLKAAKEAGYVEKVVVFTLADEMPTITRLGYSLKTRKMDKFYYEDSLVVKFKDFMKLAEGQPEVDYHKDPEKPCALAHTGGTTGFPKAVLLKDVSFNAVAAVYVHYQPLRPGRSNCINTIPPIVVYGYSVGMHMPMCCHATQVIMPKFEPEKWPQFIKKYNPAYIVAVPAFVTPMLENPKMANADMSNLTIFGVGGDGCTTTFEAEVNAFIQDHGCKTELVKGYGMTEVGASACTTYPAGLTKGDVPVNALGSVGFPHPMNNFIIWDNDNNCECRYDEIGEICMDCPTEMIGYKDNPEETKAIHKEHPDGKTWIHTGDLGYFNEDGLLFITGRLKRIILTVCDGIGYKVFPNVPEEVLAMHPAISDVCVVSMSDDADNRLKAFVSLKEENEKAEDVVEQELRELADKELSGYECPVVYEFRPSLPLTPAGKVDFRQLEKEA